MNNDNAVEHTTRAPWHIMNGAEHAALIAAGWEMGNFGLYYKEPNANGKGAYYSPPGALIKMRMDNAG